MSFFLLLHGQFPRNSSYLQCHHVASHSHFSSRQSCSATHESAEDAFASVPSDFLLARFNGHLSSFIIHSFLGALNSYWSSLALCLADVLSHTSGVFLLLLWPFLLRLLDHSLNTGILQGYVLGSHFCILILSDTVLCYWVSDHQYTENDQI